MKKLLNSAGVLGLLAAMGGLLYLQTPCPPKPDDDQARFFAKGDYRPIPMSLEDVLPHATRDYRPGQ